MATEYVTLATTSAGAHARAAPGESVEVPLDGLRGASGLLTGAPGAGVEDATEALVDALSAAGQSVLVVDPEGTHRDLASGRDVLLVGDDRDCDRRVTPTDADRLASDLGEGDSSAVLDCASSGPDVDPAELVRPIAEGLGGRRHGRSSLVLVLANCHEWLPDAGGSACADALLDLGSERTPGVGVVGVTDRPSAVDASFRRHCDWIAAHRVSWREHVDAVARILGRQYDDALESLEDGEAFLDGPWLDGVQRVRMANREVAARNGEQRSPAPASRREPVESDPGRSEPHRSDPRRGDAPRSAEAVDVAALSDELAALRERIDDLERTVDEREDVSAVAEDLADAIADRLEQPATSAESSREGTSSAGTRGSTATASNTTDDTSEQSDASDGFGAVFDAFADGADSPADAAETGGEASGSSAGGSVTSTASSTGTPDESGRTSESGPTNTTSNGGDDGGMSFEPMNFAFEDGASGGAASPDEIPPRRSRRRSGERRVPRYVRDLVRTVEEMDPTTRAMLAHYVDRGADTPTNAHFSAGGSDDRTTAYAHNRQLRTTGFIEHVGRGHYAPTIPEKVREEADSGLSTEAVKKATEHVRRALPE